MLKQSAESLIKTLREMKQVNVSSLVHKIGENMKIISKSNNSVGFGTFYKIEDSGEVYWITEKMLHSKVVLDELIKSGCKIVGYPYHILQNGENISNLATADIDEQSMEEALMMESSAEFYTQEEVMSKLSKDAHVSDVPHDYQINTKEEFVDFLRTETISDLPYPLNYIVAPEARFDVKEILPGEKYEEFFNKLFEKLTMRYGTFIKLKEFLTLNGLKPDCTVKELIMKYFEWGVDGINFDTSSRSFEKIYNNHYVPFLASNESTFNIRRIALINRDNTVFTEAAGVWKPMQSLEYISNLKSELKSPEEWAPIEVRQLIEVDEVVYQGIPYPVKVSEYGMLLGNFMFSGLRVLTDDSTKTQIPVEILLDDEKVKEYTILCSASKELLRKTKVYTDASTFKVCKSVGMDDAAAVSYIYETLGDPNEYVDLDTIAAYYEDQEDENIPQDVIQRINNAEDGTLNVDYIDIVTKNEATQSANNILLALRAVRDRLHVSIDEIMERVNAYTSSDGDMLFTAEGKTVRVSLPRLDGTIDAFEADRFMMLSEMAKDAIYVYYVTNVGTEYVNKRKVLGGDYHVAASGYYINRIKHESTYENLINTLFEMVRVKITDKATLDQLEECKYAILASAIFKAYLKQDLYIKEIDLHLPLTPAISSSIYNMVEPFAASTAALASRAYYLGHFFNYCTNAVVTPTKVYVKNGEDPIPRMHVKCYWSSNLWNNGEAWRSKYNELKDQGYFQLGFRWMGSSIDTTEMTPAFYSYSILNYMEEAEVSYMDTPEDKVFVRAPRLLSATCSGMEGVESGEEVAVYAPRTAEDQAGMAALEFGMIAHDDSFGKVNIIDYNKTAPTKFEGSDFETIFMTQKCFDESDIPVTSKRFVIVGTTIIDPDTEQTFTIHQLPTMLEEGYSVVNIFGRRYIFRDLYGQVFEVEV